MDNNFYFDESGYKGYLQDKPDENDFCLIAGFMISIDNEPKVLAKLTEIFSSISLDVDEKLHATEIFKDGKNQEVKKEFIDFVTNESNITILHSAIYCSGVYEGRLNTKNILDSNKINNSSNSIKPSGIHKKENIYHLPFEDIVAKLDEICNNNCDKLNLITDRLDEAIEKESTKIITEINKNKISKIYTGFDTETKSVVSRTLTINIQGFEMSVNHIKKLSIDYLNSNLTIAADIIVNMIYRHLKSKIENGFDMGLNGIIVFDDFELKDKIALLDDNHFNDKMYPKRQ